MPCARAMSCSCAPEHACLLTATSPTVKRRSTNQWSPANRDRFRSARATASAAVTFVVWMVLGDTNAAVERTVTVLVIACPHALGLAIPLVIAISTAVSARAGILVKDRLALERMRTVDVVLFDKTGTLTRGEHPVTGLPPSPCGSD